METQEPCPSAYFESEINKSCLPPASYVLVEKVSMLGYKQAEYHVWSFSVNC